MLGQTIRQRFNRGLLLAFVAGLSLAGYFAYQILQKNARQEVLENARLMMEMSLAIRAYTLVEVNPLLKDRMDATFLPQSVSAYAARKNLAALKDKFPDYAYKEAALNPTNPLDRATDWEAELVHSFRSDLSRKEIVAERELPVRGRVLTLARPLAIKNPGCLACHAKPADAPASMIAQYGNANGFGWNLNEIVGAQLVTVPMSVPLGRARSTFLLFIGSLVGVFALIFFLLNLLLHFVVVRPVVRMAAVADQVSMGEPDVAELEPRGAAEIASLATSFGRMRRSLESAMKMLDPSGDE